MNRIIGALSLLLLNPNLALAEQVFPRDQKCATVEQQCSYNAEKICYKEICGGLLKEYELNKFLTSQNIIGKKFNSAFELEDYFKKKLPKNYDSYDLRIINHTSYNTSEYDSKRITVLIDGEYRVKSVNIN